jgi:hypothetical protein
VLPLNGIQIHDTKRKIVFLNMKNKFRFVTVSLLLGSLVTLISSASADEVSGPIAFSFDVTDCTVVDSPAYWGPSFDAVTDRQLLEPGQLNINVTALTGLNDGYTDCADGSMDVTGYVTSTLEILDAGEWNESTDCPGPTSCPALEGLTVNGYFDVPSGSAGTYTGAISLTWAP